VLAGDQSRFHGRDNITAEGRLEEIVATQLSIPHFDPKKEVVAAKDFKPISLIHIFAKLITKIMANRLTPFLDSLVATTQSAFIKGRCMHDNFIFVQQTIKLLHRQKVSSPFLKLDVSKTFDSVALPFLMEILDRLGFGPMRKNLITCLVRTASTRILVNGQPGKEIRHQRGYRKETPCPLCSSF
jgi:hypothetical protein